ncbi:heat shock protein DNAj [Grosmannia clavigera kw1407]|uniref:Heat shock protein DNAj n=1 Tax=Grosmannia clavigera (strain kw1407 / UAMH 11150) TaxID=655863 RepID=F0XCY7_GROCL|nr:heat shock protein DNAj [Grosmannia clavigera kw1407]EFX04710.1 heat shock protein DNAj [Grosmannia clavigera kw1407]
MADIKKYNLSFYKLSKAHHPDHNQDDPHASRRFVRISEAYAILGHSEKRAVYDRDVMRHRLQSRHSASHAVKHHTSSSYHSTGPAGGRPASGLSRRRGTFKGPPPSFYRNTGSGGAARASGNSSGSFSGGSKSSPGFGTGSGPGNVNPDDFGTRLHPDTPHFDRASSERTQRRLDERSARRREAAEAEQGISIGSDSSMVVGFFAICVVLMASVVVPVVVFGEWQRKRKEPASPK